MKYSFSGYLHDFAFGDIKTHAPFGQLIRKGFPVLAGFFLLFFISTTTQGNISPLVNIATFFKLQTECYAGLQHTRLPVANTSDNQQPELR